MQNGYKNLSEDMRIVRADETGHLQDLMGIIKNLYPCGAESDAQEEYAYKLVHFEKWCKAGIEKQTDKLEKLGVYYKDNSAFVQLTLFDNTSWGIVEFVRAFRDICDREIQQNGYVDLGAVFQCMKNPPYGLYECNYYGLCVGIALQKYVRYYLGILIHTEIANSDNLSKQVKFILDGSRQAARHPTYIYTQSEKQIKLVEILMGIFEIKNNIGVICLENVLPHVTHWITDNVHYDTIERLIPEMFEIVNLSKPDVLSNATERFTDWLTDEKIAEVKRDIRRIDENFLNLLTDKYGERMTGLYWKSQNFKGGARGWLHSMKFVDEGVENYMSKETVCRECGAIIPYIGYDVYKNSNHEFDGFTHNRFTKQNIINLNKKMLGRYQNEYFCLYCLCEVLDVDEMTLYQKMRSFKEQGCTLF